jgi:hypothetical protein
LDRLTLTREVCWCPSTARLCRVRPGPHPWLACARLHRHLAYLGLTAAAEHLSAELDEALAQRRSPTQVLERLLDLEVEATKARRLAPYTEAVELLCTISGVRRRVA